MLLHRRPERRNWWPNWRGETVVIAASGESQNKTDLDYVRGKARVLVVNRTWELAPWADVLYSGGTDFWETYDPKFDGLKISGDKPWPGVVVDDVRGWLPKGNPIRNSGAQAIVYAECWGAARILLTGFDMWGKHWHPCHKNGNPYSKFFEFREGLGLLAKELTAEVINCSRKTVLDCWPRMTIEEALG